MFRISTLFTVLLAALAVSLALTYAPKEAHCQEIGPDKILEKAKKEEKESRRIEEKGQAKERTISRLLALISEAEKRLFGLETESQNLQELKDNLIMGETGKPIAQDDTSFITFKRLNKKQLPSAEEIKSKITNAFQIKKSLSEELGRIDVGFVPDSSVQKEIYDISEWSKRELADVRSHLSIFNYLIRETAQRSYDPKGVSLKQRLEEEAARWSRKVAIAKDLGQKQAGPESDDIIVTQSYLNELERARFEAQEEVKMLRTKLQVAEKENEIMRRNMIKDVTEKEIQSEIAFDAKIAELERKEKDAEAKRLVTDIHSKLSRDKKVELAEYEKKVTICKTEEVRALLAPFLAKGYSQPGRKKPTSEYKPVSLTGLRSIGALNSDIDGLSELLKEGFLKRRDRERPRWGFETSKIKFLPHEQREQLLKAQKLLIELGPVLVDLGMLSE